MGVAGGASLEFHDFVHLDCPLSPLTKSGHFVLAKFINHAKTKLEITAFKVIKNVSSYKSVSNLLP
jgi:hypothetical protein